MTRDDFEKMYLRSVEMLAESGNVDPCPLLVLAGGQVTSAMLDCRSVQEWVGMIRRALQEACKHGELQGVALGLDRVTRPDQGTTLGNVFTLATWWREDGSDPTLHVGVVEYDEGNVLPASWENEHWHQQFSLDLGNVGVWATLRQCSGRSYTVLPLPGQTSVEPPAPPEPTYPMVQDLPDKRIELEKYQHLPFMVADRCPGCGVVVEQDLSTPYLIHPVVNAVNEIDFYHECSQDACQEWVVRARLRVALELVPPAAPATPGEGA